MLYRTDPPDIATRHGAYLPHWTREYATYAVTFRLSDSLPQTVLAAWVHEREEIEALAAKEGRRLSVSEENRLRALHSERVEAYLDAGLGECYLSDSRVAECVCEAIRRFDGERYHLRAWCIMPNHMHVLVEPVAPHTLITILHSWKSFTAHAANRILKRTGMFWQAEYYDHLIRDDGDFDHALRYIEENPAKAGLADWPWVYVARASRP
jgi:REP element-mobilizing transposase RayT